jgi:hypothetical protein
MWKYCEKVDPCQSGQTLQNWEGGFSGDRNGLSKLLMAGKLPATRTFAFHPPTTAPPKIPDNFKENTRQASNHLLAEFWREVATEAVSESHPCAWLVPRLTTDLTFPAWAICPEIGS